MKHYRFHIGDFRGATAFLTLEQEGAYRRLLDWYYDTEMPIPLNIEWLSMRIRVEAETLSLVLREFFTETEHGWINERCEAEIAGYRELEAKNRANGRKGGRRKQENRQIESQKEPNANPGLTQGYPNANPEETQGLPKKNPGPSQPITNNQLTNISPPVVPPLGGLDPVKPVRATRLTLEELPVPWREFCEQERPDLQPEAVWAQFRDYWLGKPGKDGRKQNWLATWRYWVRNQREAKTNGQTRFDQHLAAVKAVCDYETAINF